MLSRKWYKPIILEFNFKLWMHRSPKERPSQGHLSPGEHFFPLNWTFTRHEEFSKIVFKPMYSFKCVRKSLSPLQLLTFFSCAWFSALMDLPKCHWATKWFCEIASPPAGCGFVLILHSSSEWADENKERGLLVTNCVLLVCLDKTQNIRNSSNCTHHVLHTIYKFWPSISTSSSNTLLKN